MRILLLLLFLLGAVHPAFAYPNPQETFQNIHKKASKVLVSKKKTREPLLEESLAALAQRQDPKNWTHISWEDFLRLNEQAKESTLSSFCAETEDCKHLSQFPISIPWRKILSYKSGYPNYKTLLRGEKLIYIAEKKNHDTVAAPKEVVKILNAVRKINPKAKILLAAEFASWYVPLAEIYDLDRTLTEFVLAWEDCLYLDMLSETKQKAEMNEKDFNEWQSFCERADETRAELMARGEELQLYSNAPLLKKAGKKSYFLQATGPYDPVFKMAEEQGIDLLALDDYVLETTPTGNIFVKIGKYLIEVPADVSIPHLSSNRADDLVQLISVSEWGAFERTKEWAHRIKTVIDNYDVVLVYAGSGHLDYIHDTNLSTLIGKEPFVTISLYPLETLSEEIQQCYTQRNQASEEMCLTQDATISEQQIEQITALQSLPFSKIKSFKNPPFWIETEYKKFNAFIEKHEKKIKEWDENFFNIPEENTSFDEKYISVFLPAQ